MWKRIAKSATSNRRIRTRLYEVWASMRKRCRVQSCPDFKNYGGRGIGICVEWNDYAVFREWALSSGYRPGLEFNRIDNDGDYCPKNCNWVTHIENQRNTRSTIMLTISGVTKPLAEWADDSELSADQIRCRVYLGWDHERAVTQPLTR